MTETGYNVSPQNVNRVMLVYLKNEAQELIPSPLSSSDSRKHGLWRNTRIIFFNAQDYLRFCQMILNNEGLGMENQF